MRTHQQTTPTPQDLSRILFKYWLVWGIPTVLATAAALFYAVWLHRPKWEAVQALLVRDEAVGSSNRPGRFLDREDRETLQETVLQLASSPAVVEAALKEIGPPKDYAKPKAWPTLRDVDMTQELIAVDAPNGAEFGRTEVFLLAARDFDRQRAIALAGTICDQVDAQLQKVRSKRARSLIDEVTRSEALARQDLDSVIAELAGLEAKVGDDLPELRILNEVGAGASQLRQTQIQIGNELRRARAEQQTASQLEQLLVDAIDDPTHLVATPGLLLDSQPALKRLKEGLVDAQLRTAALRGSRSPTHPQVEASQNAEIQIRANLDTELEIALRGVRTQQRVITARIALLDEQCGEARQRLVRLAGVRARYDSLATQARRRDEILAQTHRTLIDARSSLAAAETSSLISRVDVPRTGNYPVGPRRAYIVIGGFAGGLIAGLGLLFLIVPVPEVVPPSTASTARNGTSDRRAGASRGSTRRSPESVRQTASRYGISLKDALARVTGRLPSRN